MNMGRSIRFICSKIKIPKRKKEKKKKGQNRYCSYQVYNFPSQKFHPKTTYNVALSSLNLLIV
jgi:hypothetical protein